MITKRISYALAIATLILVAAAALKFAQARDFIDAETARRTIQVMIGFVLAIYGNFMPKDIDRFAASARCVSRSQSALRVGGWSLTLAGLAHAGLWAFAPIALADVAAMFVVAAATLVTIGYGGWKVLSCRWPSRSRSI